MRSHQSRLPASYHEMTPSSSGGVTTSPSGVITSTSAASATSVPGPGAETVVEVSGMKPVMSMPSDMRLSPPRKVGRVLDLVARRDGGDVEEQAGEVLGGRRLLLLLHHPLELEHGRMPRVDLEVGRHAHHAVVLPRGGGLRPHEALHLGETPHCGCTRAEGEVVSRLDTSHLSTCVPSACLRKSHVAWNSSLAALSLSFSSSDSSPRSAFSLEASMTSTSSKVPTPCSEISSIWSSAKSTSYPNLLLL